MKKLYVTKRIPKDATILLVDLEREYFDEVLDAIETEEGEKIVKERISFRLKQMKETLLVLKQNGHKILTTVSEQIHEDFQDLPDEILPWWYDGWKDINSEDIAAGFQVDPSFLERLKHDNTILVCGLWKELSVYAVARKLQEELGKNVLLYTGPDLTLENALIWLDDDYVTLESVCKRDRLEIEEIQ